MSVGVDDPRRGHAPPRVYRLRSDYRTVGAACSIAFLLMGGGSVITAVIEGVWLAAAAFAAFWAAFLTLGLYLLALGYRYRLFLSADGLRQVGVFRDRAVRFDEVREARWRRFPQYGSVKLVSDAGALVLEFAGLERSVRDEVRDHIRQHVEPARQVGWPAFQEQRARVEAQHKATPVRRRWIAAAFTAIALFFLAAWGAGLGAEYLGFAAVNMTFSVYLLRRSRPPAVRHLRRRFFFFFF